MIKSKYEKAYYVVETYLNVKNLNYTVEEVLHNFTHLHSKYYLKYELCMTCNYLKKELTILSRGIR